MSERDETKEKAIYWSWLIYWKDQNPFCCFSLSLVLSHRHTKEVDVI